MFIKKEVILVLSLFILLASQTLAKECLPENEACQPTTQTCWDGTAQRRSTNFSDSSCWTCTDWTPTCAPQVEICDNKIDDNQNGLIDCQDSDCSNFADCINKDLDNDGFDSTQYGGQDCDDNNPAINPSKTETCNNVDDNCNNQVDENLQQQCGLTDVGLCEYGTKTCVNGIWGRCVGGVESVDEICGNGLDEDCDNIADNGCPEEDTPVAPPETPTIISHETEPKFEEPVVTDLIQEQQPELPIPTQPEQLPCIDSDGDDFGINCLLGTDCDDSNPNTFPNAKEICDGADNNCNGQVDESLTRQCGSPIPIGICTSGIEQCIEGKWQNCNAPKPRKEICGNNIDEDCDGIPDNGCPGAPILKKEEKKESKLNKIISSDHHLKGTQLEIKQRYEETIRYLDVSGSSEIKNGKTKITIKIKPIKAFKNIKIYHEISKDLATSAKDISFSTQPIILIDDPLIAWQFANLDDEVDLSYEINKEVKDAIDLTSITPIAETSAPKELPTTLVLLPLVIIPILGFALIVFEKKVAA